MVNAKPTKKKRKNEIRGREEEEEEEAEGKRKGDRSEKWTKRGDDSA